MAPDDGFGDDERTRIGGLPMPRTPQPQEEPPPPAEVEDRTSIAPARPPGAPFPPAQGGAGEVVERTVIAPAQAPKVPGAPVSPVPPASAPAGVGEGTVVGGRPPGVPGSPPPMPPPVPQARAGGEPEPAPPSPAPAPAAPKDDTIVTGFGAAGEDSPTVLIRPKIDSGLSLERVTRGQPAERIALDRPQFVLGRARGCDIELRSPTASRRHAVISCVDATWSIAPVDDRSIYVDGKRLASATAPLVGGTRLKFGDDEFVVIGGPGDVPARGEGGLWSRLRAMLRRLFGRS